VPTHVFPLFAGLLDANFERQQVKAHGGAVCLQKLLLTGSKCQCKS